MKELWPGTRVMAFEPTLFKNDVDTPLSVTSSPATVVCWYGYVSEYMEKEYGRANALYPDLVDVIFDHDLSRISHGHFSDGVSLITGDSERE